jgi:pheromone a factor receptor
LTGRVLGSGGYGKVLVAVHQETQRQLACKIVDLRKFYKVTPAHLRMQTIDYEQSREGNTDQTKKRWPTRVRKSFQEFEILKDLSHVSDSL